MIYNSKVFVIVIAILTFSKLNLNLFTRDNKAMSKNNLKD